MAPPKAKRVKISVPGRQSARIISKYSWLQNLLEDVVLHILTFLNIDDVVRVAQTCSRLNSIVKRSKGPWKKAFLFYKFPKSDVLTAMAASSDTTESSMERSIFLHHKKAEHNLIHGRFSKEIAINYIMPALRDYSFGQVLTLKQMSLTQFEVSVWNPTSKRRLQKEWTLPYTESFKSFDLYSLLSFEDSDVGVVHAIVYCAGSARVAEKELLFGIRIVENGPIKDLWNDFSLSPGGRCQVGRVGQYLLRIHQDVSVLDHWDLTQMDPSTGLTLKTYRIDGTLRWGQTSTLSCHDESWLIVTTHTSSVWDNNRRVTNFTTVNVHEKSSKLLDPFPDPPENFLSAYDDIHVKDGQVFVFLQDMRIPVWDASSGNLVRIFSIPAVSNSIRGIVPTPGLAMKGVQIFIQTNKTDQVSWKSSIDFSMFEPNTEGDEMRIKLCSSFSFNSRTLLRRISPTDILATDFAHGHFVVVYIKDTPTKGAINIAVMSNNSNNDLGNLKITELMSFTDIRRVNRNRFDVNITPTHIIVACVKLMLIFDFALLSNQQN